MNFRRRDGNLATPTILPNGRPGLTAFGGVFTPQGNGYREPIVVGSNGQAQVDRIISSISASTTSAKVAMYNAKTRSMATVLFGGISLYDYNFSTGMLTSDTGSAVCR